MELKVKGLPLRLSTEREKHVLNTYVSIEEFFNTVNRPDLIDAAKTTVVEWAAACKVETIFTITITRLINTIEVQTFRVKRIYTEQVTQWAIETVDHHLKLMQEYTEKLRNGTN